MKVRITGNKVRLRLREPEVQQLFLGERIEEALVFGAGTGQELRFSLVTCEEKDLDLVYQPGWLTVQIPKTFSATLATSDQIGFAADIIADGQTTVYLLIEKDFECLDAPEANNKGAYPNPKQNC